MRARLIGDAGVVVAYEADGVAADRRIAWVVTVIGRIGPSADPEFDAAVSKAFEKQGAWLAGPVFRSSELIEGWRFD